MATSNSKCSADQIFCGDILTTEKIATQEFGSEKLEARLDAKEEELRKLLGNKGIRRQKEFVGQQKFFLGGGGQVKFSTNEFSQIFFERDYPHLAKFDGTTKLGLTCVPRTVIPRHELINLYREKQDKALEEAKKNGEIDLKEKLTKTIKQEEGSIPEEHAIDGLKDALNDSLCSLLINGMDLLNPELDPKGSRIEIDSVALDFETATVFVVESKKALLNSQAKKATNQLNRVKQYFKRWFGADIDEQWTFVPMIYTETLELKPPPSHKVVVNPCDECLQNKVAVGRQDLLQKVKTYQDAKKPNVQISDKLVDDFLLMAKYLIFGLCACELPTTGRFAPEVTKYMKKVGSWDSIRLWCFLTPEQMEVLAKPKIVFLSGWGGGKTIAATEACKKWAQRCKESGQKVLILVNGYNTYGQTMLLVHILRLMVQNFQNIDVEQIDFDKDSIDDLQKLAHRQNYFGIFLDEVPGDTFTLKSDEFKRKLNALIEGKSHVWAAISNFDNFNDEDDISIVNDDVQETFQGFVLVTSLTKNMRNPIHIREQVAKWEQKTIDDDQSIQIATIASLNKMMISPSNLLSNINEDHMVVLKNVLIDKTMKAVIAAENSDLVEEISNILKAYQLPHITLTKASDKGAANANLEKWIQCSRSEEIENILVTWRRIVNGSDTEVVISMINEGNETLGDLASRATNLFIPFKSFFKWISSSNNFPTNKFPYSCFEAKRISNQSTHNGGVLVDLIYKFLSGKEQMEKDDFIKTIQRPCDEFSSGLMEILFKASVHLCLCFQLISSDLETGVLKKLNLCSGLHHESSANCPRKLHLDCSVTKNFLLLFRDEENGGQKANLQSPLDLIWSLEHLESHRFGYTVHPKISENEAFVTINSGQTLSNAIKGCCSEDTTIIFNATTKEQESFCKDLHKHLGFGELNREHFFDMESDLNAFLKRRMETKNYVVIHFTTPESKWKQEFDFATHFYFCPAIGLSTGDNKILEILKSNPLLHDVAFNGQGVIQDDPFNGIAVLDHVLEKYGYTTASKSIKFMSYHEHSDNFNQCFLPLIEELGLVVNESNENELKERVQNFWDAFQDLNKNSQSTSPIKRHLQSAVSLVKRFFMDVASTFNVKICLIIMETNKLMFSKCYVSANKILEEAGRSCLSTVNVLYIFDEICQNGFIKLEEIQGAAEQTQLCLYESPVKDAANTIYDESLREIGHIK